MIKLDPEKITKLFAESDHQADVLVELYRMCFERWKDIQIIDGFPTVCKETNQKLTKMFMEFDAKHHPDVMKGGLWLNNGFSSLNSDYLDPWEVDVSTCAVSYRK